MMSKDYNIESHALTQASRHSFKFLKFAVNKIFHITPFRRCHLFCSLSLGCDRKAGKGMEW